MRRTLRLGIASVAIVLAALAPLVLSGYQMVFVLMGFLYIGLAYSWNLISGYTGYLSFGHVAFFGIGAYTVGILATNTSIPWPLAVLAGGLLCTAVSVPLGWLMLRLRGPYFAIGMLAVAEATRLLAAVWREVTRGGLGIFVSAAYNVTSVYYCLLGVVAATMLLTYWVDNSRFGLRLLSIREDEEAAEVLGINTTRDKAVAFALSALFPGLIGGLYAWYIGYIDPNSVFAITFSTNMILMTLLGGAGTFLGPLIGAVAFSSVLETLWARFPTYHLMLTGVAIVAIVLFLPSGIVAKLRDIGLMGKRRGFVSGLAGSWRRDKGEDGTEEVRTGSATAR